MFTTKLYPVIFFDMDEIHASVTNFMSWNRMDWRLLVKECIGKIENYKTLFNRPDVAGAVLQKAL